METRTERLGRLVCEVQKLAADLFFESGRCLEHPDNDDSDPAMQERLGLILAQQCDRLDALIDEASDLMHSVIEFPASYMLLEYVATTLFDWRGFAAIKCGGDIGRYLVTVHTRDESIRMERAMNGWDVHTMLCQLRDAKADERERTDEDRETVRNAVRRKKRTPAEQRAFDNMVMEHYHANGKSNTRTAEVFRIDKGTVTNIKNRVARNVAQPKRNRVN